MNRITKLLLPATLAVVLSCDDGPAGIYDPLTLTVSGSVHHSVTGGPIRNASVHMYLYSVTIFGIQYDQKKIIGTGYADVEGNYVVNAGTASVSCKDAALYLEASSISMKSKQYGEHFNAAEKLKCTTTEQKVSFVLLPE